MEFTASTINECMCSHFQANFINLPNVYVYKEESDLFSITNDDYGVVKIIEGEADYIYDLENTLQEVFRGHKYLPKIHFKGKFECFSEINLELIEKVLSL